MYLVGETKDLNIAKKIQKKLLEQGINVEVDTKPNEGLHLLLVSSKEHIEKASEIYRIHLGFPNPKAYDMAPEWEAIKSLPLGPATKSLIILSITVTLLGYLKATSQITELFKFSAQDNNLLEEIFSGQVWRLWTPILIHFGFLHIIFNMMWLKDLGKILENYKSTFHFVVFVLIVAPLSNLGQYLFHGPNFGGMSGVVYGLLGFIWMMKSFHPKWKYSLPKSDLILMIIWFILCAVGFIPQVANLAHAIGLSLGMIYGIYIGVKTEEKSFYSAKVSLYFALSIVITVLTIGIEMFKITLKT